MARNALRESATNCEPHQRPRLSQGGARGIRTGTRVVEVGRPTASRTRARIFRHAVGTSERWRASVLPVPDGCKSFSASLMSFLPALWCYKVGDVRGDAPCKDDLGHFVRQALRARRLITDSVDTLLIPVHISSARITILGLSCTRSGGSRGAFVGSSVYSYRCF